MPLKSDFSQPSSETSFFSLTGVYEANVRYFDCGTLVQSYNWRGSAHYVVI